MLVPYLLCKAIQQLSEDFPHKLDPLWRLCCLLPPLLSLKPLFNGTTDRTSPTVMYLPELCQRGCLGWSLWELTVKHTAGYFSNLIMTPSLYLLMSICRLIWVLMLYWNMIISECVWNVSMSHRHSTLLSLQMFLFRCHVVRSSRSALLPECGSLCGAARVLRVSVSADWLHFEALLHRSEASLGAYLKYCQEAPCSEMFHQLGFFFSVLKDFVAPFIFF